MHHLWRVKWQILSKGHRVTLSLGEVTSGARSYYVCLCGPSPLQHRIDFRPDFFIFSFSHLLIMNSDHVDSFVRVLDCVTSYVLVYLFIYLFYWILLQHKMGFERWKIPYRSWMILGYPLSDWGFGQTSSRILWRVTPRWTYRDFRTRFTLERFRSKCLKKFVQESYLAESSRILMENKP